jgi:hypothetical protein
VQLHSGGSVAISDLAEVWRKNLVVLAAWIAAGLPMIACATTMFGVVASAVAGSLVLLRPWSARQRAHSHCAVDTFIHSELLFLKLPTLFLNVGMRRRTMWPDEADADRVCPPTRRSKPGRR